MKLRRLKLMPQTNAPPTDYLILVNATGGPMRLIYEMTYQEKILF
jgi:hypothetical protein